MGAETKHRVLTRPIRWLSVALLGCVLFNAALVVGLAARGEPVVDAIKATGPWQVWSLLADIGNDSWHAMARAHSRFEANPEGDLYDVFFVDHVKFQYPPSALLVFDLFPSSLYSGFDSLERGSPLNQLLGHLTRFAVLLTILLSVIIFYRSVRSRSKDHAPLGATVVRGTPLEIAMFVTLVAALGLSFYPLLTGHHLGQIQVFLGCLAAAAILAFQTQRPGLAGVCLGLCCLVKPQYAVVVLWGVFRRELRFVGCFLAVLGAGSALALAQYGWANHLSYFNVLTSISAHGEAFWPNQSLNGLLHRWLENGDAVNWQEHSFAPYHPVVYFATLASSIAILAVALWPYGLRRVQADALDLSLALLAATIASPVAWEHHYGVLLPIFAIAVAPIVRARPGRSTAVLLVVAYVLSASVLLKPEYVFANRWTGVLGANLFFGAATLFALVFMARARIHRVPA